MHIDVDAHVGAHVNNAMLGSGPETAFHQINCQSHIAPNNYTYKFLEKNGTASKSSLRSHSRDTAGSSH